MEDIMRYLDEIKEYHFDMANNKGDQLVYSSSELKNILKLLRENGLENAYSKVINELLLQFLHTILVAVDGGEWISEEFRFDIIKRSTNEIMNEKVALHEAFFDYLWEKNGKDPFDI